MFSISYWNWISNSNWNWNWKMKWWSTNVVSTPIDPNKTYIDNSRARFLKLLADGLGSSSNIDSLVYNKKELHQILMDSNNELEKIWKSRLLMEYTPLGNIVMFYDIFKQGFSYYSDQSVVSYDILNSVAMKYVAKFSCVDFFMDEYVLGNHGTSPLKPVFIEDDDKKKPSVDLGVDVKNAPFAKLKNYSASSKKDKISGDSVIPPPVYFRTNYPWLWKTWFRIKYYLVLPVYKVGVWAWSSLIHKISGKKWGVIGNVPDTTVVDANVNSGVDGVRNKFIYLGRFRNFNILQKTMKKGVFVGGATKYDSMFGCVGGKAISYKDFKMGGDENVS